MEGEVGIVRRVSLAVGGNEGIHRGHVQNIGVLLEALVDRVAHGQCAADATDNQAMPPKIRQGMQTMYSSKRTGTALP